MKASHEFLIRNKDAREEIEERAQKIAREFQCKYKRCKCGSYLTSKDNHTRVYLRIDSEGLNLIKTGKCNDNMMIYKSSIDPQRAEHEMRRIFSM